MQFKRTSLWLKLAILAICVFCIASLISIQTDINKKQASTDALRSKIVAENQSVLQLEEDLNQLGTPESARKLARERLGFVEDGEIVFYDSDN